MRGDRRSREHLYNSVLVWDNGLAERRANSSQINHKCAAVERGFHSELARINVVQFFVLDQRIATQFEEYCFLRQENHRPGIRREICLRDYRKV